MDRISTGTARQITDDTQGVSRRWLILAVLCIPVFLGSLDLTVVSAFLPVLVNELNLTLDSQGLSEVSWVVTSYLLAYSVSLFAMGRVSDFIGRRATLVICLLLYVAGSLLVISFENTVTILTPLYDSLNLTFNDEQIRVQSIILGRVIAAFGAGAITSIAIALVGDMFSDQQRAIPLGIVMALDTVGWLIGAAWGGVVVQFLPWRAIFLINIPLVLLAMGVTYVMLREVPQMRTQGKFDVSGLFLLAAALTSLNIGLVSIDSAGDTLNLSTLLLASGVTVMLASVFVLTQRRSESPLIDPAILNAPGVMGNTIINLVLGFCMFIPLVSIPLLVNIQGLDEIGFAALIGPILDQALEDASLDTGILMAAFTIPLALASVLGGWLTNRIGALYTLAFGLLLAVLGYGMVAFLLTLNMTQLEISLMMAVSGTGIGIASTPIISRTLTAVTNQQRGMASALLLGVRMIGMTIATSTLSTFGAQRVTDLVEATERGRFVLELVPPENYTNVFPVTYINAAIQTINEMAFFGLVGCVVASVIALLIRRKDNRA